jgi:hypothetical protein
MFIFTTDQELWLHELMNRIMSHGRFLDWKGIIKFILLFHDPIWVW